MRAISAMRHHRIHLSKPTWPKADAPVDRGAALACSRAKHVLRCHFSKLCVRIVEPPIVAPKSEAWAAPSPCGLGSRSGRRQPLAGDRSRRARKGGGSAHSGGDRFCNPIGAVKRHVFTFFLVMFLCSARRSRFFAPAYHASPSAARKRRQGWSLQAITRRAWP